MKAAEFFELVRPVAELIDAKDNDYNSDIELEDYFPFGHESYVHMLNTKVLRLRSLLNTDVCNFESQLDTVNDLIAYAVFYRKALVEDS